MELGCRLCLKGRDGGHFGKGSPAHPMSYDDVAAKFLDCAAFAKWPVSKANAIVEMVRKLEQIPDMRKLTALLG